VSRRFHASGAKVGVHYRNAETVALQLTEEIDGTALHANFDTDDVENVCEKLVRDFPANVFVLNASAQTVTPWADLTVDAFDNMYRNSLRATAAMVFVAARHLMNSSDNNKVIVIVGSIEGIKPARNHAAYATMKAALHHLVMAAAHELGGHGIRVVGVAPGLIHRDGLEKDWPEGVARWNQAAALGRPVTNEEVADAIHALAHNTGITGVTLPVDAGWSANPSW
jgi:3-oxoacyl-[acyl-carrier protein] reductase